MRRLGAILALLLVLTPAWATAPGEQSYEMDEHGLLVTDAFVDGQGPFRFLIDTASSRTLIFEHVRAKLGLKQSQPAMITIYGLNDFGTAMPVKPQQIQVAGQVVSGLTLGVLPDEPSRLDGILGIDVLARYLVVLDRASMRLKLLPPTAEATRPYEDWTQASLTPRMLKKFPIQFWYVTARFNDKRITGLFDLGAAMTMINWEAAEELQVHQSKYSYLGPPPVLLQDVLGARAPALRISHMEVRLSNQVWWNQTIMVADAPIFDYFDLEEKPAALVGQALLHDNSLAIDFAHQRLFIGPRVHDDQVVTDLLQEPSPER